MELAAQLIDVTPGKLEMSQLGHLAAAVACSPAWREDTLISVVAMSQPGVLRHLPELPDS